jgi:hypothetical protein
MRDQLHERSAPSRWDGWMDSAPACAFVRSFVAARKPARPQITLSPDTTGPAALPRLLLRVIEALGSPRPTRPAPAARPSVSQCSSRDGTRIRHLPRRHRSAQAMPAPMRSSCPKLPLASPSHDNYVSEASEVSEAFELGRYADARQGLLRTGGDFPFLSRCEETAVFIQVRYPARHGIPHIPHGTVSRTAPYPARHGIPRGTVSRTARYPVRHCIPHGIVSHTARSPTRQWNPTQYVHPFTSGAPAVECCA